MYLIQNEDLNILMSLSYRVQRNINFYLVCLQLLQHNF